MSKATNVRFRLVGGLVVISAAVLILTGCSRARYRCKADTEVYQAVQNATCDPRWRPDGFTINPDPRSRMFDPGNPDYPPMPPDNPESHRLMHCVDCKRGWPCWHCYGNSAWVENPGWQAFLPRNDKGEVVLDRRAAVQMALLNSTDYQSNLEQLYLTALDVTFQRFRFDTQFFFTNSTFFTQQGPAYNGPNAAPFPGASVSNNANLQAQRLFATGGNLIVGFANSVVWQFSGSEGFSANSLLNFTFVQPLLRNAGRAVVLASLTTEERSMLANIRQMEQYRRGFYNQIVAGANPGPGPVRSGPVRGPSDITALDPPGPNLIAGGFLDLLEQQVQIRNQQANISALERGVDRLQANFQAGRLADRFQVDLPRLSLYRRRATCW